MENAAPAEQASAEPQPEPAPAEVEAPRRRWLGRLWDLARRLWDLLRRVPTALVASLLGVLLTAWLVPAFTQQWNDRQKARDVQASIVADFVAATTILLSEARIASDNGVWESAQDPGYKKPEKYDLLVNQWAVAVLKIKARLSIYLGSDAIQRWKDLSAYTSEILFWASGIGSFVDPGYQPPDSQLQDSIDRYAANHTKENMRAVDRAFFAEEESLTSELLSMHVQGYSTRWRDIASALFPFV